MDVGGGSNWKIPLILPTECRNKKRHETAAASAPLASWGKSLKVWGHQVNLRRRITQEMVELGFGHSPRWVMEFEPWSYPSFWSFLLPASSLVGLVFCYLDQEEFQ